MCARFPRDRVSSTCARKPNRCCGSSRPAIPAPARVQSHATRPSHRGRSTRSNLPMRRSLSAAPILVTYVPRFYGLSHEEAFELPLSEREAQLAVAREHAFVSWDAFMATVRRLGFWVAAGLGDVHGMARFFDRRGRLTDAVREFRPPFDVVGPTAIVVAPDADDEELLAETALVAFLAERANAVEYLVQRGFAVDSVRWGMPFAAMAAGNKKVALLEALVRCGAILDLAGHSNGSAREMAREHIRSLRVDDTTRRIGVRHAALRVASDARAHRREWC